MKTSLALPLLTALLILLTLSGCSDANHMDKTAISSNLIEGQKVSPRNLLAKRVVLIAQRLEIKENRAVIFGLCSGVIIGDRTVLTAAHCLENGTQNMRIILNPDPKQQIDESKDVYSVVDKEIHNEYVSYAIKEATLADKKRNSDLAILYVDRPLDGEADPTFFRKNAGSIFKGADSVELTLTGFGKKTALLDTSGIPFNILSGVLRQARAKLTTDDLRKTHFTLTQSSTFGICDGDSGAPVYIQRENRMELFGLAVGTFSRDFATEPSSFEKYTECAHHGVFINLRNYKTWIEDSISILNHRN